MKKSIYLALILSIFLCCAPKQENDIDIIVNEDNPQHSSISLIFEEDLRLKEDWVGVTRLLPDKENNLFVFDDEARKPTIYKFNSSGKLELKKSFNQGQGPGDFYFMDPNFSYDGKLYVFDKRLHRLTVLDSDFEIEKIVKFKKSLFHFKLDSKNFIYGFFSGIPNKEQQKMGIAPFILGKFAPNGKFLYEIFSYVRKDIVKIKPRHYIKNFYCPFGVFKIDKKDNIFYIHTDKYEINIVNSEGQLIKKIIQKNNPNEITQYDIDRTLLRLFGPRLPNMGTSKWEYKSLQKYKPVCDDFFILDNGYLMVLTYEYDDGKHNIVLADLFDEKGNVLTKVEVPRSSMYYQSRIDYKTTKALKGDYFYTVEGDYVKRYKMIWKDNK